MRPLLRTLPLALVPVLALLAARPTDGPELVDLAGLPEGERAELRFEVRASAVGEAGSEPALAPARLTLVPVDRRDGTADLFANPAAAPRELAARANVVYTRTGAARITVPPGRYVLHASRGPEWSIARTEIDLPAGSRGEWVAHLRRELDTAGWIGADFHLHTLTHSGHGDASVEERVLSFLGEGLELAVATDHDHHTDYRPTMRALGVADAFTAVTGNEVSTPIGHFNAFPLDPAAEPVDSALTDANALFRLLRAQESEHGVVPVIQLNHPRLPDIDYFGRTGLDPVTGTSSDPAFSLDFDAIEVLNENLALGYDDPVTGGRDTHGHVHSALADWFHLLDRGHRPAIVGNSDSHHVAAVVAGYPRNYVASSTDEAGRIDPAEVAAAVRAKRLFTTTGPFLEVALAGAPMGGDARATDGHAPLSVRVRAASWVGCDRVKVVVNGAPAATLPVPPSRDELRLDEELELCFMGSCQRHGRAPRPDAGPSDAWVVVIAEGDGSLEPVLAPGARPLAIANPIWVDADGDGRWIAPVERAGTALRAQPTPEIAREWFATLRPEEQALALGHVTRDPLGAVLVELGFASPHRGVRLAAARASEATVLPGALTAVQRAWAANADDLFLGALLVRVMVAARPESAGVSLASYAERFGETAVRRYADELLPVLGAGDVQRWRVVGPLPPAAEPGDARPPTEATDGDGIELAPGRGGYVDLRAALGGSATDGTRAVARVFLESDAPRTVLAAFGSDDGGRVWLGERLLYENRARKTANPLEKLLTLELEAGWNALVLEIENATGGFGFHFRVLDPTVETALAPE